MKSGVYMVKLMQTEGQWVLFDGSSTCKSFYASQWAYFDVNSESSSEDGQLIPVAAGVIYDGDWVEDKFLSVL